MRPDTAPSTCWRCHAGVADDDWVCAACDASLLLELRLDRPILRGLDAIARELNALRRGQGQLDTLRAELARPQPVVARAVTRRVARQLALCLERYGLAAQVQVAAAQEAEPKVAAAAAAGAPAPAPAASAGSPGHAGIEREPCPHCGEPTALSGAFCSRCRGALTVDVTLDAPVGDGRVRYRLARELAALGPPLAGLPALQNALAAQRPTVARYLTRLQARNVQAVLKAQGLAGQVLAPDPLRGTLTEAALKRSVATGVATLDGLLHLLQRHPLWTAGVALAVLGSALVGLTLAWTHRSLPAREVARRAGPATALVSTGRCSGSGFFVADELLLTNAHVLCGSTTLTVTLPSGKVSRGTVRKSDPDLDLAVLDVPGAGVTPLPLGDATLLEPGDPLVIIGAPRGLPQTVHQGRVSNPARPFMGYSYVQIDGNINPGNSGGPVLDARARVVGIVTLKVTDADQIGLALPINYAYARSAFVPGAAEHDWRGVMRADLLRFDSSLAAAQEDDLKRVAEFSKLEQPALLEAAGGGGGVRALLLRRAPFAAMDEYAFQLEHEGQVFCRASGVAGGWNPFVADPDSTDPFARWLRRHDLGESLFVGEVALTTAGCPDLVGRPGVELVLVNGHPDSSRVSLAAR